MMRKITLMPILIILMINAYSQNADEIIGKVEKNISSENRVFESSMTISGSRTSRTITSRTWSVGYKKSFTEYLSPPREQGTKMLKLENQLWIYSPSTDRIIQISGHMLRQSVMGSDMSYEDMMDDRKITEVYTAEVKGTEDINGRKTWVLELTAKVPDAAYHSRRMSIDSERFVPLKEELFAKSGQLLKMISFSEVKMIEGRWFPTKMVYKDVLKQGNGTEFVITSAKFNQTIPDYIFSKASLKQ